MTRPERGPGPHHHRLEPLEELVDRGHVVGPGDQPLDQPLAGLPVLDLVVSTRRRARATGPSVTGATARRWRS